MSDPTPVVSAEVVKGLAEAIYVAVFHPEPGSVGEALLRMHPWSSQNERDRADYMAIAVRALASPEFAAVLGEAQRVAWDAGAGEGLRTPQGLGYMLTNPYPGAAS